MAADKVIYRRPTPGLLATSGDTSNVRGVQHPIYEALVTDIILDHNHPFYSKVDGYNVGSIRVRILDVNQSLDETLLPWADPLDSSVVEYPLLGELVVLYKIRGNFFYSNKVAVSRRVQQNAMLNLNQALNRRSENTVQHAIKNEQEITPEKHRFGEYFKPDSRVRPLKSFEGDVIYQGRMGQTIRFGSSKMDPSSKSLAPNLILRAGQAKDVETSNTTIESVFGLVMEDINNDASSIWMVADQNVPFEPTTSTLGSFYRSIASPTNKFDKASIIINSDRVVLNSKKQHLMLFSNKEIYLNSSGRTSIDSNESIYMTANKDIQLNTSRLFDIMSDDDMAIKSGKDVTVLAGKKMSILGEKVFLGNLGTAAEPLVGGTSLSIFLARLIQVLVGTGVVSPQLPYQLSGLPQPPVTVPPVLTPGAAAVAHVITPLGPGALSPTIIAGLSTLYAELATSNPGQLTAIPFSGAVFNSYGVFTSMANQNTSNVIVLNEFDEGEQTVTENNDWKLSESYYKVT